MLSAIDAPKSKSISIAFSSLKSMTLSLFLTLSFSQLSSTSQCTQSSTQLATILKLFYILGILLSLFLLIYFLFTATFNRMEYFILFGYQVLMLFVVVVVAVVQVRGNGGGDDGGNGECWVRDGYIGGVLFLGVVFVVDGVVVMWANMYFGIKFVNFGSNIVWGFLWLSAWSCNNNILIALIGSIHLLLSVSNLTTLLLQTHKKTTKSAKCSKYLYTLSIILLLFCYITCWIAEPTISGCPVGMLFVLSYQKFGLIQLISPVLVLVFVNTEMGDPRERILREEIKEFGREREKMGFVIDDTN